MMAPDAVRAAFASQSRATGQLGSPFYSRLMQQMQDRLDTGTAVGSAVLNWAGDPSPTADNVPLRLAGGLHALVISGTDPGLAAVYPPHDADPDAVWDQICRALSDHEAYLLRWLDSAPQTNEVRRAGGLVPAFHLIAAATGKPLALWEIGCSGGLNLRADLFSVEGGGQRYGPADSPLVLTPDWEGPAPAPVDLRVSERRGVDLNPLDPSRAEDCLRLRAYLWPDQIHRRQITDAAIAIARSTPAEVDRADALDWLAARLPDRPGGTATVLFHSVAWQYLPPEAKARGDALIAAAGAAATESAPLARLGMEFDGGPMAALTLRMWPGDRSLELARVDFHGRRVQWTGPVSF